MRLLVAVVAGGVVADGIIQQQTTPAHHFDTANCGPRWVPAGPSRAPPGTPVLPDFRAGPDDTDCCHRYCYWTERTTGRETEAGWVDNAGAEDEHTPGVGCRGRGLVRRQNHRAEDADKPSDPIERKTPHKS